MYLLDIIIKTMFISMNILLTLIANYKTYLAFFLKNIFHVSYLKNLKHIN